ncbi:S-adenosyl-L-methionine-dependent methyltransferase [Trema orientale]|uniref:S-adenosyl-L-methionine-dependent methyltransferase n=1 Tax=Trema orientale TaxID=63057 RepID=A0A2P5DTB7_TREOI|nr:S-adenosyl-L-methionine-dependent methyltransferase [Trema orientale]
MIKEQRKAKAKAIAVKLAYVILLLLTYTLGYLVASYPSSSPYPPLSHTSAPSIVQLANLPNQLDHFRVTTHCADRPVQPGLVRQTILDRVFNSTSPYQDFPPPHVRGRLRPKRIKGWGSNGAVFENLIRKVKPRTIIEVGTFLGASAIHMANLTRQLGLQTQILCIDDFRGWPGFRDRFRDISMVNGDVLLLHQFMQNVVSVNFTDSVLPVPFSTGSVLDKLCEWGIFGDLIEVDAGHDFNSAWSDINRAYRILRPGGVLFGHDYFTAAADRGVKRAVTLFARVHNLKIRIDGQHWVMDPA